MIKSMTAYARKESRQPWGSLTWELRSVNHRYLEPVFRMPEAVREIEPQLRQLLGRFVSRGKLECWLHLQLDARATSSIQVNMDVAENLNHVLNQINRVLDNPAHISAFEVLRWPGVMDAEEFDHEPVREEALSAFEEALEALVESREKEGERLKPLIEERVEGIRKIVSTVRDRLPQIIDRQNEALRARFEDLDLDLDPGRLEQEMVMLAQKADVAEELDRLETHCAEVKDVLRRDEPVGRRLDFLMQELNREANTLGSKSLAAETSQLSVDLKVLVEQMREQVQNIE